jgi:hypothetical protein
MVCLKIAQKAQKAQKAAFSCAGLPIIGALLRDFDRQNVRLLMVSGIGCFTRSVR